MRSQQSYSSVRFLVLAGCLLLAGQSALAEKFNSRGRRDPFMDLMQTRQAKATAPVIPPLAQRPPGLAGLLIAEVTVAGTAGSRDRHLVILKGIDKVSYIAHEGSRLYDGYVRSISSSEVVFVREGRGEAESSRVVKQVLTEQK